MPGASGLDVISKVKEDCEKSNKVFSSFIILSGFSDFAVLRTSKLQIGKTFLTLGKNCKGLEGIIDSYQNAKDNEKYLFFYSELPYISDEQINFETKEFNKKEYDDLIDNVIFCIETYNKNQLEEDKKIIKEKCFNINEPEQNVKKIFIYFLIEIHYQLEKKYPERDVSDGETFDVVKKLLEYNNFDDIFNCFSKILNNFLENFNFNTADSVIVKVLAYVKTNYALIELQKKLQNEPAFI